MRKNLQIFKRDSPVLNRVIKIFEFAVHKMTGHQLSNKPKMVEWNLPSAPASADRGCTLHAIINMQIAGSARDAILTALDDVICRPPTVAGYNDLKNRLYDETIPAIIKEYMWGPGMTAPPLISTPSNHLHDHYQKTAKGVKGRPSWFDLALFESMIWIMSIALFRGRAWIPESLGRPHHDMQQKMHELQVQVEELGDGSLVV